MWSLHNNHLLMLHVLNSIPLLYLVMLWPARFAALGFFDDDWYYAQMMHDTGVWSVRWLVLTLSVTPALMVLGRLQIGKPLGRWLLQRRKHFGLVSFIFAAMHVAHYILDTQDLSLIWLEAFDLEFAMGWLAFFVLVALAATSNRAATKRLGRNWKKLHRWIYAGSAMTFLHWLLFDDSTELVVFWAVLLTISKAIHVMLVRRPKVRLA